MITLLVILLIVIVIWIAGPYIRALFQRWLMRRLQKSFFKAAGIPDPEKERKNQKKKKKNDTHGSSHRRHQRTSDEPIIPRDYAEDVEFTEYKEYTTETSIDESESRIRIHEEEQVSDVQFTEIKDPKK